MPVTSEMLTFSAACRYFSGGVNSPVRACRSVGVTPPIVNRAFQDVFFSTEGKKYIDFCGSWGSLIHGHSHPKIVEAIQEAASRGSSYGLTSQEEIQYASALFSCLGLDDSKIRFVSSGTEATMTAVRVACGVTNRSILIKFDGCYHGHADVLLKGLKINEQNIDVLEREISAYFYSCSYLPLTLILPYNDIALFRSVMEKIGDRVAGVIFEPICINMGVVHPKPGFLEILCDLCRRYGALSIIDEVVTGFRVGLAGMRSIMEIVADLTVYGKIIGGGLPVAAIVGNSGIMNHLMPEGSVFQAGTLSGNPLGMAAGKASLSLCEQSGFYEKLDSVSKNFLELIEDYILEKNWPVKIVRQGSMFTFFFTEKVPANFTEVQSCDHNRFSAFYRNAFSQGVYLSPAATEASFISAAHSEENLAYAQNVLIDSLTKIFE